MSKTDLKVMDLVYIQTHLKAPKNQFNKFGGYRYRSCEDIMEALKPLLLERDCILTMSDDIIQVGDRVYVKATATLTTSEGVQYSNTAFAREAESKKGMDESQVTGTASSYARKYALNGLFCIDDTKDVDALNTSKEYTEPQQKSQTADVAQAIAEVSSAKTIDEITALWNKYKSLQKDVKFKTAVAEVGTKLRQAS